MSELYYSIPDGIDASVDISVIKRHLKALGYKYEISIDGDEVVFIFKKFNKSIIRFSVINDQSNFCTFDEYANSVKHVKFIGDIDKILRFSGFVAQDY